MSKVEKLELEIKKLGRREFAAFRNWFRKYDSDEWDREIEEDVHAGKLDALAKKAILEHKAGRSKEL